MKNYFSFLTLTAISYSQNMRQNAYFSLFADQKASYVGDAITIIVVESSLATNKAKTSSGRQSDLSFDMAGKVVNNDVPEMSLGIDPAMSLMVQAQLNLLARFKQKSVQQLILF